MRVLCGPTSFPRVASAGTGDRDPNADGFTLLVLGPAAAEWGFVVAAW